MKAFIVDRYGKREQLRAGDVPEPKLRADEVLIQVHAAAVNLIDAKVRNGEFKLILPYRTPFVLGHDVAGVVLRVGPRVRQFKPGDEVYARPDDLRIGTFAEFVAVKEDSVAIKPRNLTMEEAASIPLVGLTAWQALVEMGRLQKGQKVFIQAGSGGVGTFAIQLAKYLGATVATTTSAGNVALVKSLGADVVIDYKKDAFEEHLRDYDVVLNSQDGKTLSKSLGVLKPGGHLVSISGPPRPAVRRRHQGPVAGEAGHARPQLRHSQASPAPQALLRLPVHEGQRKPAEADCLADRVGRHPPGGRQGLPVRLHQRSPGLRRKRPSQGQGGHQGSMNRPTRTASHAPRYDDRHSIP